MKQFVLHLEDGTVVRLLNSKPTTEDVGNYLVTEIDRADGGRWPAEPYPGAVLVLAKDALAWKDPRTLDEARADKWAEVKAAGTAAIDAPLATPWGTFDHDAAARFNIFRCAQRCKELSAAGKPADIEFTLAGNGKATLQPDQMVQVWMLSDEREQPALKRLRSLREQIDAAADAAQLAAIVW